MEIQIKTQSGRRRDYSTLHKNANTSSNNVEVLPPKPLTVKLVPSSPLNIIYSNNDIRILEKNNVKKAPKIVGETRHYPPANKEWKNSVYAFNKNHIKSLPALDKMSNKTIKSYFNLSDNKKLARSRRMRNLIRRSTVKRLFASRPEIKQTSDKVNVTVYTFNRERQFLLRKMYFYNRNMYIDKDIYLYKLWLKKNLMAFKKTFTDRLLLENEPRLGQSFRTSFNKINTKRSLKNKTYIHNILLNKYLMESKVKDYIKPSSKNGLVPNESLNIQGQGVIRRNLVRSLRKHNIMRFLKKRVMKRGFRRLNAVVKIGMAKTSSPLPLKLQETKIIPLRYKAKNYFANKVSRKVRLVLRNKHNIFKIKEKLKKLKKSRFGKIRLPYSNLKFKNEIKFFSFRLVSELKFIRKLFFYYFIKYIFSIFQIKIKMEKKTTQVSQLVYEFTEVNEAELVAEGKKTKIIKPKKRKTKIIKYSNNKLKNIENLNLELLNFLKLTLTEANHNRQLREENLVSTRKKELFSFTFDDRKPLEKLDFLYKNFEKNYFLFFLSQFFKKEFLYLSYYSKFLLNQLKFGKLLPGLKLLISKIYSKKVELNIVNLKYPHLNSDIYTDSIATKLRKKLGLLRVLRWSLKLARLPYKYYSNNNAANLNKLQSLNIHKSLDINSPNTGLIPLNDSMSEDKLQVVLNKLYSNTLIRSFSGILPWNNGSLKKNTNLNSFNESKVKTVSSNIVQNAKAITVKSISVLNILRYKWVSGVRLEAAGRLTRRYTAARSVFKFRYKGNLKNIDYSLKTDTSKKNVSTVMLRNYAKANSQYTFTKSKRRIGAFGLKGWISSY